MAPRWPRPLLPWGLRLVPPPWFYLFRPPRLGKRGHRLPQTDAWSYLMGCASRGDVPGPPSAPMAAPRGVRLGMGQWPVAAKRDGSSHGHRVPKPLSLCPGLRSPCGCASAVVTLPAPRMASAGGTGTRPRVGGTGGHSPLPTLMGPILMVPAPQGHIPSLHQGPHCGEVQSPAPQHRGDARSPQCHHRGGRVPSHPNETPFGGGRPPCSLELPMLMAGEVPARKGLRSLRPPPGLQRVPTRVPTTSTSSAAGGAAPTGVLGCDGARGGHPE